MGESAEYTAFSITVFGQVQGVGYRYYALKRAAKNRVTGWVRNKHDSSVEIECEGLRKDLDSFIEELKSGPAYARVTRIEKKEKPYRGVYSGFEIEY